MSAFTGFVISRAKYAALCAVLLYLPMLFTRWYAVSGIGHGGLSGLVISSFLVLPLLLVVPAVPVGALLTPFRKLRRIGIGILVFSIVYFVVTIGLMYLGKPIRTWAFDNLAIRSQPLVEAISRFNREKGHPPAALQDLVPEYLPAIPNTGMPCYPDYKYSTESDRWEGNPWVLYIDTPTGLINWDMFVYFPLQNYPREGYGGYLEKIRNWAYVHE